MRLRRMGPERQLAADLGGAETVVFRRGEGIVLVEPSVVAIDERSDGLAGTGRVVTRAGLIMAARSAASCSGRSRRCSSSVSDSSIAILSDITLVRGLLLPSTMALTGRWNWYLARWAARAFLIRA